MCCKKAGTLKAELGPTHNGTVIHTSTHKTGDPPDSVSLD